LLAQGVTPGDAAIAAVFLHGAAGDSAAAKYGQASMIAGDIIKCLGEAFKRIQSTPFLHEGRRGGIS
jgi:NAD(P)H-hydrate epimerase